MAGRRLAGALALCLLPGCSALDWLAEPACPCPPGGRAALDPEPVPIGAGPAVALPGGPARPGEPVPAGRCSGRLDLPGAALVERPAPIRPGPSRGEVLVRGAARAGGVLTGNPIAWTIVGQLVAAGARGLARRRRGATA